MVKKDKLSGETMLLMLLFLLSEVLVTLSVFELIALLIFAACLI